MKSQTVITLTKEIDDEQGKAIDEILDSTYLKNEITRQYKNEIREALDVHDEAEIEIEFNKLEESK